MKKIWVNKAHSFKEAKQAGLQYWQEQSPQIRFIATWKAVDDYYKMKGCNGYKRRLQRTIQNIKQI